MKVWMKQLVTKQMKSASFGQTAGMEMTAYFITPLFPAGQPFLTLTLKSVESSVVWILL